MGFTTIDDVMAEVAERLGLARSDSLRESVREEVSGRYEDVTLNDEFLRAVWRRAEPSAEYPF